MAVTNFSPLLGLALPTTGDLSGIWGTTVNNSITNLIDSAVAGTTTLSADVDVTLSTTNGSANQARNAIILWTATGTTTRNITAPAQSKAYLVINSTGGTQSIVIRGAGPTTGVTIPAGARALVAWNGSDFVKIVSNPVNLTSDVTGVLPEANGGTGESTYTNGQLLIGNAANGLTKSTLTAGSNITITNGDGAITIAAAAQSTTFSELITVTGTATTAGGIALGEDSDNGANTATVKAPADITSNYTLTLPQTDGTTLGYLNIPQSGTAKTTNYALATTDVGKVIEVGTGGSITVPDATFSAGDAIIIFNNTSGSITMTMTITNAYIAGTNVDKATINVPTRGVANILFVTGTTCVVTGNVS
jgi:hypothetical protein